MADRGRVRVEQGHKRVRAFVGGGLVFDTIRPMLVWELPYFPAYYIPATDIDAELVATGEAKHSPSRGDAEVLDVHVGAVTVAAAAARFPTSPIAELIGLVRFDWDALDEWFEEDEPVYTHPRDPYTRVDILASSRNVRVAVEGVTVADSSSARILYETHLPPRYYLPLTHVRTDLLQPSSTRSHCPYKGEASWWSVVVDGTSYDDLVWAYRSPFAESHKIAGLACFYNEKVDIYLDGVLQERPRTHFG